MADGKSYKFEKLEEIGHFSLNSDRQFQHDDTELRYYVKPTGDINFILAERSGSGSSSTASGSGSRSTACGSGSSSTASSCGSRSTAGGSGSRSTASGSGSSSTASGSGSRSTAGGSGSRSTASGRGSSSTASGSGSRSTASGSGSSSKPSRSGTKYPTEEKLKFILEWIKKNPDGINTVDIICCRGLLKKVLMTITAPENSWKVAAIKFREHIYLCEIETVEESQDRKNVTKQKEEEEKLQMTLKFTQHLTSDRREDTEKPVNCNNMFYSVVTSSLNNLHLLYACEIDCARVEADGLHYMELKFTEEVKTNTIRKQKFYRKKLPSSWAQSYIARVDQVVYGFTDINDKGGIFVNQLEYFQTLSIPKHCSWNSEVAVNFCGRFLDFVKKMVTKNSNREVYEFDRRPDKEYITCQIGSEENYFLPEDYIDWYHEQFGGPTNLPSSPSQKPISSNSSLEQSSKPQNASRSSLRKRSAAPDSEGFSTSVNLKNMRRMEAEEKILGKLKI